MVLQCVTQAICREVESKFKGKNLQMMVYLDDFGIWGEKKEVVAEALELLRRNLQKYGFAINEAKSSKKPTQSLEWLGLQVEM